MLFLFLISQTQEQTESWLIKQWVNSGVSFLFGSGSPSDLTEPDLLDKLSSPAEEHKPLRTSYFNWFRDPADANAAQQQEKLPPFYGLIGVAAFFEGSVAASLEEDSFTLDEAVSSGCWYSSRLPGGKLVAVYMTDSDLLDRAALRVDGWLALLHKTEYTAQRVCKYGGGDD